MVQRAGGCTIRDRALGAITFSQGGGRVAAGSNNAITTSEPDDEQMMLERLLIREDSVDWIKK